MNMDNKEKQDNYDILKLDNQFCFPLYVISKEIVRQYKPYLDEINLTYTQYIAMMVMWEDREINVKELGKKLFLDSGTLTPLLKTLEKKGFVTRERSSNDERLLIVKITEEGLNLREKAVQIPAKMTHCIDINIDDAKRVYEIMRGMLGQFEQ